MAKNFEGARFGLSSRIETLLVLVVAGLVAYGLYQKYVTSSDADRPIDYNSINGEGGLGR